jgi:hypothetical protein
MFHWHAWSKWEVSHTTDIVRSSDDAIIGYAFIQKRVCAKCGYAQYKKQEVRL